MGWMEQFLARHELPADYARTAGRVVAPLAEGLREFQRSAGRPIIVGISGAQGTGKTTFASFLAEWLNRELKLKTACLSLDDVCLSKAQRNKLSQVVHPLLVTRGVPGTHDVELAKRALDALTDSDLSQSLALPAFDKARDDRAPQREWPIVEAPVEVVLFEGWCVGARPQPARALAVPVNALEAEEDSAGTWRRWVNERLGSEYAELFGCLDLLVLLRIHAFAQVFEWRALQERKLREHVLKDSSGQPVALGLTPAQLIRFIQHYERVTRHMLATMPGYADAIIDLDDEHRMTGLAWPSRPQ